MALFNKKKKEKNLPEKTATAACVSCKKDHLVAYEDISTIETGYKGKISFYSSCPECGTRVYFDEVKLSRTFVRRAYRTHRWD